MANVPNGTYNILVDSTDTGKTVAVSGGAASAILDYYTVQFAVANAGAASGSSISATYGGTPVNTNDVVLGGKELVITAAGAGASSYTYAWSGTGTSGESTAALTIGNLSAAVNATCTVTGKYATLGTLTPTVSAEGTASVSESAGGGNAIKYAIVSSNPTTTISGWTVNTSESDINTALNATLSDTAPTGLTYTSNGKYLVAVEIDTNGKAVNAGSYAITGLASAFSISSIGAEGNGGVGKTRTITVSGTFTGSEYLVVQHTEGTGENAKVTATCIQLHSGVTTVNVSSKTSSQVYVLITDGMPNLTGSGAMNVTVYDQKTSS